MSTRNCPLHNAMVPAASVVLHCPYAELGERWMLNLHLANLWRCFGYRNADLIDDSGLIARWKLRLNHQVQHAEHAGACPTCGAIAFNAASRSAPRFCFLIYGRAHVVAGEADAGCPDFLYGDFEILVVFGGVIFCGMVRHRLLL